MAQAAAEFWGVRVHGVERLTLAAKAIAIIAAAFAILVLLGWAGLAPDLSNFGIGEAHTSAVTAFFTLLSACAIYARHAERVAGFRDELIASCCAVVLAISCYTLGRYAVGAPNAGYLLGPGLGAVSVATALSFLLLSSAILAITRGLPWAGAILCAIGLVLCETALVGYLFGVEALARVFVFSAMALPTALLLTALFAAALMLEPGRGWSRPLVSSNQAGATFWALMPAVLVLPVLIAGLVLLGVKAGVYQPAFAFALLAVSMTAILAALVFAVCVWLERSDRVRARLAAIVDSSDDAIIGKSLDGEITSWNAGAERLYGYTAKEAIGQKMRIVMSETEMEEENALLARVARNQRVEHFETHRRRKDGGEFDVSVSLSPVRLSSGEIAGASSITRDITDLKRQQEELRRSNADLQQFAYVASHDLQEPLRMVASYVDLLAERYKGQLDDRADRYIGYASEGARRMQQLVKALLTYSRLNTRAKPFAEIDLNAVAARTVRALGLQIHETGAEIEIGVLPSIEGDEVQLEQLFQNLIANALKFRGEAAPRVRIDAKRQGRDWEVSVSDNGIGMDMRHVERIFEMFQRLHARGAYEGSGIGLALAKRIVERHGGRIWVESAPGEGSTFYFTLKASQDA